MPLFQPKALKALRTEIAGAHAACTASKRLAPDHQKRVAATAPKEIAAAARAAAQSGHADEARQMLNESLAKPPASCPPTTTWPQIVQAGLDALGG